MKSRSFISRREAQAFDGDLKARKFRGDAMPRPGKATLGHAWEDWRRLVGPRKAESTRRSYDAMWAAHVAGRFDHYRLTELSAEPQLFDEFVAEMESRGVGRASQRKTLIVISAVLTQCVEWNKIAANPLWRRRARVQPATRRAARPFPPFLVERIRAEIARRETKAWSARRPTGDAVLVSLLAYAGLRPQETLALRWGDIGKSIITIDKAASYGVEKSTKTNVPRSVPLVMPLGDDLRRWRETCGGPSERTLVFPDRDGQLWSHSAWNNWRGRVWKPALRRLAEADPNLDWLPTGRPYDCRGSFVSLHLRAGASPLEVARWAGHSPQVMFRHYANVIEELVGEPLVPPGQQIELARQALASRAADEVKELTAEVLKPPREVSNQAYRLLYGERLPRPQPRSS